MKYMKIIVIVVFIIVTTLFTLNWVKDKKNIDTTIPEIQVSSDILDVSVKNLDTDILKGVVARDGKDGDLTSDIFVESISKFINKQEHIATVTYVVKDRDNHVSKKMRKIRFTDYVSPKFKITEPLILHVGEDKGVADFIGAIDCIDGDISGDVKILSNTVRTNALGESMVTAQVTNRFGDTSKLKVVAVINQHNEIAPKIVLKENLVYIKKDSKFNADQYVDKVTTPNGKTLNNAQVSVINSSVNTKKKGSYTVQYMTEDEDGIKGYAYLAVVVEEE